MADIYDWSTTPATNSSADSAINWAEGMDPDQVNDSARQMMARVAEVLDDIAPTRSTTGTGNAYAITSAAVTAGSYNDGEIFSFIIDRANTSAATLNVNGRGAVALRPEIGREFAAGELRANQPIIGFYRSASNEVLAVGSGYHVNALTSGALTQSVVGRLMKVGTPYLSMSATVEAGSIRLTQTTQTLNKADWPELSSWLSGQSYPWGSTSTTFNLPPAAGYFLRFAATSTAIDTSGARTAGSTQSDQNKAHTHGAGTLSGTTDGSTVVYTDTIRSGVQTASSGGAFDANIGETTASRTSSSHAHTFTVTGGATGSSGGDEVRVKNVAFHVDVFASSALATGALAQFGFSYAFDASTTSSDPGSGNVRLNNATLASVTEIYISETDSWGVNISGFLSTIENGVRVRLSKIGAQASTVLFTASGAPTDNGGWRTIPGAVTVSGGSFTAGDSMAFEQFSGAAGDAGDPGAGIDWQGAWLTATAYAVADGVSHNGASYICTSAHTSGAGTEPLIGASWATVWDVIAARGLAGSGTGDMLASANLADVANAASAFGNIKQAASDTATGVVELATDAEAVTGTDTGRAVTPSGLKAHVDASALAFKTIAVSGQSDVVADSRTDTLTLAAGSNVTITTNAATDTVTIAASGGSATAPTRQTFTSGSGTYTTPASVVWIRVRMVGGGGGGGGSGGSPGNGGTGGNTTFSSFTASGGNGSSGLAAGAGGAASGGTINTAGGRGGDANNTATVGSGYGGMSLMGPGAGPAVYGGSVGRSATANTGGGGSGGTASSSVVSAAGGGGGGYVEGYIASPAASYSYAIGSGGTAGTAGSSGSAGGAGGSGYIIVEEFY